MELKVIGTGSAGNSYILTDERGNSLILELGVNFKTIQQNLNFNLSKVAGCLVTHEHGDHAKYIDQAVFYGLNVYATSGTLKAKNVDITDHNVHIIKYFNQYKIGPYTIIPFDTQHDVAEPCGFLIYHPEMGNVLFLTDTTYSKYNFENLSHVIIETNYSEQIIEETKDPDFLKNRIVKSHMSIETAITMLKRFDLRSVKSIILIHLSDRNADANLFKNMMTGAFGINTDVAQSGSVFYLNEFYF